MIKRKNRLALASMRDVAIVWSSEFVGQAVTLYSMTTLRPITPNHDSLAAWIATIDDIELTENQLWQLTGL